MHLLDHGLDVAVRHAGLVDHPAVRCPDEPFLPRHVEPHIRPVRGEEPVGVPELGQVEAVRGGRCAFGWLIHHRGRIQARPHLLEEVARAPAVSRRLRVRASLHDLPGNRRRRSAALEPPSELELRERSVDRSVRLPRSVPVGVRYLRVREEGGQRVVDARLEPDARHGVLEVHLFRVGGVASCALVVPRLPLLREPLRRGPESEVDRIEGGDVFPLGDLVGPLMVRETGRGREEKAPEQHVHIAAEVDHARSVVLWERCRVTEEEVVAPGLGGLGEASLQAGRQGPIGIWLPEVLEIYVDAAQTRSENDRDLGLRVRGPERANLRWGLEKPRGTVRA